jgi:peroxidase
MARNRRVRLVCEELECRQLLSGNLDLAGVEWRSIDGADNNTANPMQGAAETRQIRFGYGAQFPDGFGDAIIVAPQRANPRTISNTIHAQSESVLNDRHLTDWVFQWGQFITHDIDLTRNGPEGNTLSTGAVGDFHIPIENPNDPLGPNPIPFNRSEFDPATGTPDPVPGTPRLNRREVINSVTSYIDGSLVYGSDPERAVALRTFQGGRLKTSANGLLPPLNDDGLPNADPFQLGTSLFLAGDVRSNEQTGLTVTHTLFIREHNRLADRIASLYPELSDVEIFQIARRIVGAEIQIITYDEYLPAVLGGDRAPRSRDAVYDPAVNASITNSFAHAAFRFGHSQISETTLLVDNSGRTLGGLSIRDTFFDPDLLKNNPGNVELVLKGLASQVGQENDLFLVDGVRNNLFGPPGSGGLDLAALDIQRGRDHGLPDYNTMRAAYGLARVTSFAEISSDLQIQVKLQYLFGNVNNIDAFVGGLAEDHLPGSSVGPLIQAIVGNQFERLRDGDRFFYTNDAFLQSASVRRIIDLNEVSLAQIIRWNTTITHIQDDVFRARRLGAAASARGAEVAATTTDNIAASPTDNRNGQASYWFADGNLTNPNPILLTWFAVGNKPATMSFCMLSGTSQVRDEDAFRKSGSLSLPLCHSNNEADDTFSLDLFANSDFSRILTDE